MLQCSERFAGGQKIGREPDFLGLCAGSQLKINPTLAAMEGIGREVPTVDEAREQLYAAVAKLKSALP
jgi:hypothetical protein